MVLFTCIKTPTSTSPPVPVQQHTTTYILQLTLSQDAQSRLWKCCACTRYACSQPIVLTSFHTTILRRKEVRKNTNSDHARLDLVTAATVRPSVDHVNPLRYLDNPQPQVIPTKPTLPLPWQLQITRDNSPGDITVLPLYPNTYIPRLHSHSHCCVPWGPSYVVSPTLRTHRGEPTKHYHLCLHLYIQNTPPVSP